MRSDVFSAFSLLGFGRAFYSRTRAIGPGGEAPGDGDVFILILIFVSCDVGLVVFVICGGTFLCGLARRQGRNVDTVFVFLRGGVRKGSESYPCMIMRTFWRPRGPPHAIRFTIRAGRLLSVFPLSEWYPGCILREFLCLL